MALRITRLTTKDASQRIEELLAEINMSEQQLRDLEELNMLDEQEREIWDQVQRLRWLISE